jgi:hypothetical protein
LNKCPGAPIPGLSTDPESEMWRAEPRGQKAEEKRGQGWMYYVKAIVSGTSLYSGGQGSDLEPGVRVGTWAEVGGASGDAVKCCT